MVPPADERAGSGEPVSHPADRLDSGHEHREGGGRGAGGRGQVGVPAGEVEQGVCGHRRRGVDGTSPRQRVVGDRLGRPVAGGVRRLTGEPAEEGEELAAVTGRRRVVPRPEPPVVAVEEAGPGPGPVGVDRTQGGHHGRHRDTDDLPAGRDRPEGSEHVGPPRLVDLVLEGARDGLQHGVGEAGPRQDRAVGVGGDGLDRRGADVDADRDVPRT